MCSCFERLKKMKFKLLHKKKWLIFILIILLLYVFPIYHLIPTNVYNVYSEKELSYLLFRGRISHHMQVRDIIDKAEKAFGETDISEEEAAEKYGLLSRYCYTNESYEDVVKENHNLRVWSVKLGMNEAEYDGYIWCCYSQEGMNEEGVTITGSKNVPALWCLEQDEQGTWDVAEIKEMP